MKILDPNPKTVSHSRVSVNIMLLDLFSLVKYCPCLGPLCSSHLSDPAGSVRL